MAKKDARETALDVLHGLQNRMVNNSVQENELNFLEAAERQEYDTAAKYLKMGVNPNCYHPHEMDTALHTAANNGDLKIADLLYKTGKLNMNCFSPHGIPPLITATMSHQYDFVRFMLSKGAKVNITDRFKRTALHHAVFMDWIELVKLLLKFHCDRNPIDAFFETPLSNALAQKLEPMVHLLVDNGADVNLFRNDLVCHIFLELCLQCRTEKEMRLMQYLFSKGVSPNVQHQHTRRNAFHLIAITNYLPLTGVLNSMGTNAFDRDVCNMLPYHIAKRHGHLFMADILEEYYLQQYTRELSQCLLGMAVKKLRLPKEEGEDDQTSHSTDTTATDG